MIQGLISQSPDIQKVLAFEGAFEKLFNIISHEGGVDGGAVARGALSCVDSLLRFNSSNQVIFGTSFNVTLRFTCIGLFPRNDPTASFVCTSTISRNNLK